MFNGAGAESLCCGTKDGYAIEGGASANLISASAITVTNPPVIGRDVPFPMVDPYGPVNKARVPVPGYNRWPKRANRLGRRYYGLAGLPERTTADRRRIAAKGVALKKADAIGRYKRGFAGLGLLFDPIGVKIENEIGPPPVYKPPSTGGGINWDTFFGGLFKTLPGTISAITGKGDPILRQGVALQPSYQQYGAAPDGYSYNSSGQLVKNAANNITDFITENPLLVGGVLIGGLLLFMRPPGRR